jgi:hypothetical protein
VNGVAKVGVIDEVWLFLPFVRYGPADVLEVVTTVPVVGGGYICVGCILLKSEVVTVVETVVGVVETVLVAAVS